MLLKALTGSAGLRLVGMAFGFLVGVQLARGLGVEGYGIYGVAMSIIALLTVPTEFGLPQLLTREVTVAQAKCNWGRLRGILQWATRASMSIAVCVGLLLVLWLLWFDKLTTSLGQTLLAGVVMVPLLALLSLRSAAIRGLQRIVAGQLPQVALRPVFHSFLLFIAPLLLFPLTPSVAMWLGVFAVVCALALANGMLKREMSSLIIQAPAEFHQREWWSSALPMAMTEGMRMLQGNLLVLLLSGMVAIAEVGIFRMASSVMTIVAVPLSLFNIVTMPVVARLYSMKQTDKLQRMLRWVVLAMLAAVTMLAAPFFIAGEWLLGTVFGEEFAAGSPVLVVLCIGVIVNAAFGINAALLNMTNHQNRVTLASAAALAALVTVSPPLVWGFGIMGAAVANLISVITWNVLMWWDCRRLLGLDPGLSVLFFTRRD